MNLEFSFFKASITPSRNINLVGQAKRDRRAETLGPSDLFVRIMWLRADADLVFISMDSLYFSRDIASRITEHAHLKYNIPGANIIFNASHTHSAPGQDMEFFGYIDNAYVNDIEIKIKQGLDKCYTGFIKGHAEFSHIDCGNKLFISRRKVGRDIKTLFFKKRVILLPNEEKPVDNAVHLIKLFDKKCALTAIVFNFSCHPVFNISAEQSSDFAGAISSELENKICRFAMFLQGFSGDVRPNYTQTKAPVTDLINFLKLLFNEKVFSNYTREHFTHFCDTVSLCIIQNATSRDWAAPHNASPAHIATRMYVDALESRTGKTTKDFIVKLARISNNLFISIPAEVLSGYVNIIGSRFPGFEIYPLGYADGMIGYLPIEKEIFEGGYEVETSFSYYGWDDCISALSVKRFTEKLVSEIAELVGNN